VIDHTQLTYGARSPNEILRRRYRAPALAQRLVRGSLVAAGEVRWHVPPLLCGLCLVAAILVLGAALGGI
jgi:hypothetical protein